MTKQLTRLAAKVTDDVSVQKDIITYGLDVISKKTFETFTPSVVGEIYDYAKKVSGINDPYESEKEKFNDMAEFIVDERNLKNTITESNNPMDTAIRLSIAGNIIDFSLGIKVDENGIRDSIEKSLVSDLYGADIDTFISAVDKSDRIMVLGDNSGEIVLDKLLIERLPLEKVVYVVKGDAIVNDATMKDAIEVGMDKLVNVIDNGAAIQGTIVEECSESFIRAFDEADLIISKGQANFETLSGIEDKNMFFMLRAKCQSVADEIGCNQGEFVFLHKDITRKGVCDHE